MRYLEYKVHLIEARLKIFMARPRDMCRCHCPASQTSQWKASAKISPPVPTIPLQVHISGIKKGWVFTFNPCENLTS